MIYSNTNISIFKNNLNYVSKLDIGPHIIPFQNFFCILLFFFQVDFENLNHFVKLQKSLLKFW